MDLVCHGTFESETDLLLQERAPVRHIRYNSPQSRITPEKILGIAEHYRLSLCSYVHLDLPRIYSSRGFHDRADSSVVLLVRECRNLTTLALNCKLSTCTLLVISLEAKQLHKFYVRRQAILLRRDWPMCGGWSRDQYDWLMNSSLNYDIVEQEVSHLLRMRWNMLSDKQYKALSRSLSIM